MRKYLALIIAVAGILAAPVTYAAVQRIYIGAIGSNSDAALIWDSTSHRLGVNTTTPNALVHIVSSSTVLSTLVAQATTSQTSALFDLWSPTGGSWFSVANGNVNIPTATASSLLMTDANKNAQSVVLGTNLSFSGNTLNATGGSGTASGTAGSVQFSNGSGGFNADQASFVWDNINKKLGVNSSTPASRLSIQSPSTDNSGLIILASNAGDNDTALQIQNSVSLWQFSVRNTPDSVSKGFGFYGSTNGGFSYVNPLALTAAGNVMFPGLSTNALTYTDGSKNLANVTVGSGLSFSGGTLSATGGGTGGTISTSTNALIGRSAVWTGASTLGNGIMSDNGVVAGINATSSSVNFLVQGTGSNVPLQVNATGGGNLYQITSGGNEQFTAANTQISTSGQSLVLQQTGDTFGKTSLTLVNRNGQNGAVFSQASGGAAAGVVDFLFQPDQVSNPNVYRNLRVDNRGSSFSYTGQTPEMQFGNFFGSDDPTFILGNSIAYLRKGQFGVGTGTPAAMIAITGSSTTPTFPLFIVASSSQASIFQVNPVNSTGGQGRVYINPQNPGDVSSTAALEIDSTSGLNSDLIFKNVGSGSPTTGLANASGTPTNITNLTTANTTIGSYDFYTWVPTSNWVRNTRIVAAVDGTLSTSSAPSRLLFQTTASGTVSSATRMIINNQGNVAIGNVTPSGRLTILGLASQPTADSILVASSSTTSMFKVTSTGDVSIGTTNPFAKLYITGDAAFPTKDLFSVNSSTSVSQFVVKSNGNVGIASSTPGFKLSVAGPVAMTGLTTSAANQPTTICQAATGELISYTVTGGCVLSTKRVKTGIEKGDYGLDLFLNLKNSSYFYKSDWLGSLATNPNYAPKQEGVIAEDVAAIAPNLVTYETSTSTYDDAPPGTVHGLQDFAHWIGPITQAFQDLNSKITKAKRSAEENWQWIAIGSQFIFFIGYIIYNEKRRKK